MRRSLLGSALVVFVPCCLLATVLLGQQTPTFRSGVDLVTVDVRVVDGAGRPVTGLRPEDFVVTVDGTARTIVTADFMSYPVTGQSAVPAVTSAQAAAVVPAPSFSSNVAPPVPGRTVVLVVDEENIRAGYGKWAGDAAVKFVDAMRSSDRVGLLIPRSNIRIAPTTDRAAVKAGLSRVVGHMVQTWNLVRGIGGGSMRPVDACDAVYKPLVPPASGRGMPPEPRIDPGAMTVVNDMRDRAINTLRSLVVLIGSLQATPGPKTIVLISEELPVCDYMEVQAEFKQEYARVSEAAARARAMLYVMQLDRPAVDPEDPQRSRQNQEAMPSRDADIRGVALEAIVSVTGGKRLLVSGIPDAPMARIALEISGQYVLGIRAVPADRDGKTHRINVAVKRSGVEVRARQMFAYTGEAGTGDNNATDAVNRMLRAATVETGIPIAVATYSFTEPGSADPRMRVLVTAEIDRGATKEAPLTVGYAITDASGRNGGANVEQVTLKPAVGHPDGSLVYTAAALVPPGSYALRLAAADSGLRLGSVTHQFDAGPVKAGAATLSDLVVFDPYVAEPNKLRPSVSATALGNVSCYVETYLGGRPPDNMAARLELADTLDAPARVSTPLDLQAPDSAGRIRISGVLPLADVPPGVYVARAVLLANGAEMGRVSRSVRVAANAVPAVAVRTPERPLQSAVTPPLQPPVSATLGTPRSPAVDVADLMARVAAYIDDYAEKMLVVVGVEHYTQWLQKEVPESAFVRTAGSRALSMQTVAEFALVRNATDWDGYRNVYEVDGKPIPEAKDRFQRLFAQAPANATEQSRKIAAESARYNMGALQRNFNVPTIALFFLTRANQKRFKFAKDRDDEVGGTAVWKVKFEETHKPAIIKTSSGRDMPVKGEAWIDPVDGRVLRTHMQIDSEMPVAASARTTQIAEGTATKVDIRASEMVKTTASIMVTYVVEARLGLLVPSEMLETYEAPMRNRFSGEDEMTKITCRAAYSDFKRFETSGRLVTPK